MAKKNLRTVSNVTVAGEETDERGRVTKPAESYGPDESISVDEDTANVLIEAGAAVEEKEARGNSAGNRQNANKGGRQTYASGSLPEGYPGRNALIAGKFDSLEKVASASDEELAALDGVGPATVTAIREYK